MAGKRAVTPAMREHLRIIGQKGGKSTSQRYGGWAAPHASRKARGRKAPSNVPATSMRKQGTSVPRAPAKVVDTTHASTIAQARVLGLPPSAFTGKGQGVTQAKAKSAGARISSRKGSTTRSRLSTLRKK